MASAMDASDDEELHFGCYSQRKQWADVSPVQVDDGNCVVAVQYTKEHAATLSYFRAVLASGEKSSRVAELAADMIMLNQVRKP